MSHQPQDKARRNFLLAGSSLALTSVLGNIGEATAAAPVVSDPHAGANRVLTRIAMGSCLKEGVDAPILDTVVGAKPDLFVFLGDNIYGDSRDMAVLQQKYARQAADPRFKNLREKIPHLAIWDDHDYGENDAGSEYPMKEESRRLFCDFWNEPANSPRRTRDGVYAAYLFGPVGKRVQVILPDLRFNRTSILKADLSGKDYETWAKELAAAGKPVLGPYIRNADKQATMLGERQWQWLEAQLRVPADVRIIASSLQVLADFPGWEAWINYSRDHQRLIELIRKTRANGVVFVSGDTHYGELSLLDVNVPYPLWDMTASGLTQVWPVLPPNANRVGDAVREVNFGVIEIDWGKQASIELQLRDISGTIRQSKKLHLRDLRV